MARWPFRLLFGVACIASCDFVFRIDPVPDARPGIDGTLAIDGPLPDAGGSGSSGVILFHAASRIDLNNGSSATTLQTLTTVDVPANSMIVVHVGWGSGTTTVAQLMDTRGSTYMPLPLQEHNGEIHQQTFYAQATTANSAVKVTVMFSASTHDPDLRVLVYSNATRLDHSAQNAGNGQVALTSITRSAAGDWPVAGATLRQSSTGAPGNGFMSRAITQHTGSISEDEPVFTASSTIAVQATQMAGSPDDWIIDVLELAP